MQAIISAERIKNGQGGRDKEWNNLFSARPTSEQGAADRGCLQISTAPFATQFDRGRDQQARHSARLQSPVKSRCLGAV